MENTMQRKTTDMKSMIALVLFVVVLIGGFYYTAPLWGQVDSLQKGRSDLISQRDDLQKQLSDLKNLQQSLNLQSEVSRETNLNAIPVGFDEAALIRDINQIGDQSRVTINSINFGIPTGVKQGEIGKVSVNANLTTQQSDLLTFLRGIESDSRKILVKNIAVQIGATEIGNRVNFNVSMETYFQGKNQ